MCVFGIVSLNVLWRVFGEYWMCVFVKVSLSVLWQVFGEYWICVFGKVSSLQKTPKQTLKKTTHPTPTEYPP
jgi:hypothetical protein